MNVSESAGGVVLNAAGEVLVVNQKNDSWSLPKGHIEPGEKPLEAAIREIREESGIRRLEFVRELGTYERPRIGKGGKGEDPESVKRITLFLFRTTETELRPEDPDNPEARWVRPERAAEFLTHPGDREFFQKLLPLL